MSKDRKPTYAELRQEVDHVAALRLMMEKWSLDNLAPKGDNVVSLAAHRAMKGKRP